MQTREGAAPASFASLPAPAQEPSMDDKEPQASLARLHPLGPPQLLCCSHDGLLHTLLLAFFSSYSHAAHMIHPAPHPAPKSYSSP